MNGLRAQGSLSPGASFQTCCVPVYSTPRSPKEVVGVTDHGDRRSAQFSRGYGIIIRQNRWPSSSWDPVGMIAVRAEEIRLTLSWTPWLVDGSPAFAILCAARRHETTRCCPQWWLASIPTILRLPLLLAAIVAPCTIQRLRCHHKLEEFTQLVNDEFLLMVASDKNDRIKK